MNIETKYNIGDTVWMMFQNNPTEYEIKGIKVFVQLNTFLGQETIIVYDTSSDAELGIRKTHEKLLFPSKEELIQSL